MQQLRRSTLALGVVMIGCVLAGGGTAAAGTNAWTVLAQPPQTVPEINSISFGPHGVAYASGGSRAFRSTDGGHTWVVASQNLGPVTADPFDGMRVYAWRTHWFHPHSGRGQVQTIGISTDGGATWIEVDPHLSVDVDADDNENAVTVVPDPSQAGRLYLVARHVHQCEVLRSTNHGASWSPLDTPFVTCDLAVDGTGTLYTGLDGHGVMRSSDAGATWHVGSSGIPHDSLGRQIVGPVVVSPTHPGVAYTSSGQAIYASTDGGDHWSLEGPAPDSSFTFSLLAVDRWHDRVLWASNGSTHLVRSTDAGATWSAVREVQADPFAVHPLAFDTSQTDHVLAAPQTFYTRREVDREGILSSPDDGTTWAPAEQGLRAPVELTAVALSPDHPGTMYGTGIGGGYVSHDGGATWSAGGGPPSFNYTRRQERIAVIPGAPDTVIAYGETAARSADGGATWQPLSIPGSQRGYASDIALGGGSTVYAALNHLWVSHDRGATWSRIDAPRYPEGVAAGPAGALYVCNGRGVWHLTGTGWTRISPLVDCRHVTADPNRPGVVYAMTYQQRQLLRTLDGGATWTNVDPPQAWGGDNIDPRLLIDPNHPDVLYLDGGVRDHRQLLRSPDQGDHWVKAPGDTTGLERTFLDVAPGSPTRLLSILLYDTDPLSGPLDGAIMQYTPA